MKLTIREIQNLHLAFSKIPVVDHEDSFKFRYCLSKNISLLGKALETFKDIDKPELEEFNKYREAIQNVHAVHKNDSTKAIEEGRKVQDEFSEAIESMNKMISDKEKLASTHEEDIEFYKWSGSDSILKEYDQSWFFLFDYIFDFNF